MNKTEINKYLTNPELVDNASSDELRHLTEIYPYCEALHWIFLRSLYINDDATFDDELMKHGMHISNRRLFFNYLTHQEETDFNSPPVLGDVPEGEGISQFSILNSQLATPDYFALEQNQAQKQSLQQLAAQLKAARLARQKQNTQSRDIACCILKKQNNPPTNTTSQQNKNTTCNVQINEENAKKLIKEQKYLEAIEILRAISLNNPKKSANFALQIKFLETIINNHNKN